MSTNEAQASNRWSFSMPEYFSALHVTSALCKGAEILDSGREIGTLFVKSLFRAHDPENPEELTQLKEKSVINLSFEFISDIGKIWINYVESVGIPEDDKECKMEVLNALPYINRVLTPIATTFGLLDAVATNSLRFLENPKETGKKLAVNVRDELVTFCLDPQKVLALKVHNFNKFIASFTTVENEQESKTPFGRIVFSACSISVNLVKIASNVKQIPSRLQAASNKLARTTPTSIEPKAAVEAALNEGTIAILPQISNSNAQPANNAPLNKQTQFTRAVIGTKNIIIRLLETFGDSVLPWTTQWVLVYVQQLKVQFKDDPSILPVVLHFEEILNRYKAANGSEELVKMLNFYCTEENIHRAINSVARPLATTAEVLNAGAKNTLYFMQNPVETTAEFALRGRDQAFVFFANPEQGFAAAIGKINQLFSDSVAVENDLETKAPSTRFFYSSYSLGANLFKIALVAKKIPSQLKATWKKFAPAPTVARIEAPHPLIISEADASIATGPSISNENASLSPPAPLDNQAKFSKILIGTKDMVVRILETFGDTVLPWVIQWILPHVQQLKTQFQHDPSLAPVIQKFEHILTQFGTAGSTRELIQKLNDYCSEENILFLLNNLPLNSATSATESIEGPSQPPSRRGNQPLDVIKETEFERQRFALNISRYAPLKVLSEWFCGITKQPDEFYFEMMKNNPSDKELRSAFFKYLDQANLYFFVRWFAKFLYFFAGPVMHNFIEGFSKSYMKNLRDFVDKNDRLGFEKTLNQNLEVTNDFLNTLVGAYRQVANDPNGGNVDPMVAAVMSQPEANGNMSPKELNNAVAEKAIHSYLPSLGWSQAIKTAFTQVRIPGSSLLSVLNLPLQIIAQTISLILITLIIVPEWIFNQIIAYIAKRVITKSQIVDTVLDKTTKMVHDNSGLTYATMHIMNGCLEELRDKLQFAANNPTASLDDSDQNLMINDDLLRGQVDLILQLVPLANIGNNKTQLEQYVRGEFSSLPEQLLNYGERIFNGKTADGIKKVLIKAYNTFMKKEYLEQKIYEFLKFANESFESANNPEREAHFNELRIKEEQKMRRTIKEILAFSIHHEITQILEFRKNPNVQQISNKVILDFQTRAQTLVDKLEHELITPRSDLSRSISAIQSAVQTFKNANAEVWARIESNEQLNGEDRIKTSLKNILNRLDRLINQLPRTIQMTAPSQQKQVFEKTLEKLKEALTNVKQFKFICFDVIAKIPYIDQAKNYISNIALARINQLVEGTIRLGSKEFFIKGLLRRALFRPFVERKD